MNQAITERASHDARRVALLDEMLTELGGAMNFDAATPPATRKIALLTAIRDALSGAGPASAGVLGGGVTGITFLFRPLGEPGDAETMSGYVVHGPHVNSFTLNTTHDYAPDLLSPVYEIRLDRAYEPDEVAVLVWPGAWGNVAANLVAEGNISGALGGGWAQQGRVHLPQVWQTGPGGDKSMRLIIPVTLDLGPVGGCVTWIAGRADPLTIVLVFFDRGAADYREPPIPVLP